MTRAHHISRPVSLRLSQPMKLELLLRVITERFYMCHRVQNLSKDSRSCKLHDLATLFIFLAGRSTVERLRHWSNLNVLHLIVHSISCTAPRFFSQGFDSVIGEKYGNVRSESCVFTESGDFSAVLAVPDRRASPCRTLHIPYENHAEMYTHYYIVQFTVQRGTT